MNKHTPPPCRFLSLRTKMYPDITILLSVTVGSIHVSVRAMVAGLALIARIHSS